MKILVTGGAGFLGSHLVEALIKKKYDVTVIDNLSTGFVDNLPIVGCKFINDDITLKRTWANFKDEHFHVIIHLAAQPSARFCLENPAEAHNINVNGTLNVLEYARKTNVRKVVFASSAAVFGGESPYALHKAVGEEYMRAYAEFYSISTFSFRFFNLYGPRQNIDSGYASVIPQFIKALQNNEELTVYGDGNQTRDFVYIKDAIKPILRIIQLNGRYLCDRPISIGTGKGTTINTLAYKIAKGMNKKLKINYVKDNFLKGVENSKANISLAKSTLRWNPDYSLKQGLKETIEYYAK